MWELDCEESWSLKNWWFWTVVLDKTLESPLDCNEIQPVCPKGDQSWVFTGRADAKAETPVLWPPHVKSLLIGKDSDAGRDWGQEKKGSTEDEMAGWHHWLDRRESEWTLGVGDGQGGLVCCNSWGCKESDTTEWLNWNIQIIHVGVFFLPCAVDWMFMSHPTPTKIMCWEVIRFNVVTSVEPLWWDCVCVYAHSVMFNSLQPRGLQPARLLCPWDSPGKNTGVGSLSLLQGIFPIQGLSPLSLLHWQADSLPLSHQRSHDGIVKWSCSVMSDSLRPRGL